jgi:hypothetical protein
MTTKMQVIQFIDAVLSDHHYSPRITAEFFGAGAHPEDRSFVLAEALRSKKMIKYEVKTSEYKKVILNGMIEDSAVRSEAECIFDQLDSHGYIVY